MPTAPCNQPTTFSTMTCACSLKTWSAPSMTTSSALSLARARISLRVGNRHHVVLAAVHQQPRHYNLGPASHHSVNLSHVVHVGLRERAVRLVPHAALVGHLLAKLALGKGVGVCTMPARETSRRMRSSRLARKTPTAPTHAVADIADRVAVQGAEHRTEIPSTSLEIVASAKRPSEAPLPAKEKRSAWMPAAASPSGERYDKGAILVASHAVPQDGDVPRSFRASRETCSPALRRTGCEWFRT